MKLCISNLSFKKKNFEDFCKLASKENFKYLELAPSLISFKTNKLLRVIKTRKLKIQSIQSVFFEYNSKNYKNFKEKEFINTFRRALKFAKEVSAKNLCIGNSPSRSINTNNKKKLEKLNLKYFKFFAKLCKNSKIKLLIEPQHIKFNIKFLNNNVETFNFISNLDNAFLLLDSGNIRENKGSFEQDFINFKSKIRHIHFRNENKISFEKKLNFLNKQQYKYSYSIESFENYGKKFLNLLRNV